MADNETSFTLQITIDGKEAQAQAGKLRENIEAAIGAVDIKGQVNITGLAETSKQLKAIRSDAEKLRAAVGKRLGPMTVKGEISITGLADAERSMKNIRRDAGELGAAVQAGLAGQLGKVDQSLAGISSKISGIIARGKKSNLAENLLGAGEMDKLVAQQERSTRGAVNKIQQAQADVENLNAEIARLGLTVATTTAGGVSSTLKKLYDGLTAPGTKRRVTMAVNAINKELDPIRAEIAKVQAANRGAMAGELADLEAAAEKARAHVEAVYAQQPKVSSMVPSTQVSIDEWDRQLAALQTQYDAALAQMETATGEARVKLEQQIAALEREAAQMELTQPGEDIRAWVVDYQNALEERDRAFEASRAGSARAEAAGTEDLQQRLWQTRQRLQKEYEGSLEFFREWSMSSADEVVQALDRDGQAAAAQTLQTMLKHHESLKKAQDIIKTQSGKLGKAATVDMPKDAEGTMVDFVAAEYELGKAIESTSEKMDAQVATLRKLVRALDTAVMAGQGFTETERFAVGRIEGRARSEMKSRTGRKATLEESGAAVRDVLGRMSAEMAETFGADVIEGQEKQARGLVAAWEWVREKLVGHSVIPEMVVAINEWLDRLDLGEMPLDDYVADMSTAAGRIIQDMRGVAEALPIDEVDAQVAQLGLEISGLESEVTDLLTKSTDASRRYREQFALAVKEARRIRGENPEDEQMYAQGYLPRGFKIEGEQIYDTPGGRRLKDTEETTDQWRRVLNTDIEATQRLTKAQSDRLNALGEQITARRAQMLALIEDLQPRMVAALSDPAYEQQWSALLARLGEHSEQFGENLAGSAARALGDVAGLVDAEMADAADAAQRRAAAAARSPAARIEAATGIEEQKRMTLEVRAAAASQLEIEKRLTLEAKAQWAWKQKQKQEAARRVTIRQKEKSDVAVLETRARLDSAKRLEKSLGLAQQLAGELGQDWVDIEQRMGASAESVDYMVGALRRLKTEQAAANKESERQARMMALAKQLAAEKGVAWSTVEQAMAETGASVDEIVGSLRRVQSEQRKVARGADDVSDTYDENAGAVKRFTDALENARRERQGLMAMTNDVQQIGNSLRMNAGIMTGAMTVAGRDYAQFAKQSDVAARSLALNVELTKELRDLTIEQSTALAVADPTETARGLTMWAQATGQQIKNQEQLNALLEQAVPIQQAAALSQTDVAQLGEATAGAINQFGLSIEDTNRIVAIFNMVADDTLAEVGDVAQGFKMVGPSAERAGEGIETTAKAFMLLGDAGVLGTQAGTSYGMMLSNLLVPKSTEAQEVLEQMFGTDSPFYDAQGQFLGTARAVDMLAAATADMSDKQREAAFDAIFETNALRAATVLIGQQADARAKGQNILAQGAQNMTADALGVWEQQVAAWEESDVYRLQQAEMRWKAFWLEVGSGALQQALPYIERASVMVDGMIQTLERHPEILTAATWIGAGGLAAGTLLTAVGTLGKIVLTVQNVGTAVGALLTRQKTTVASSTAALSSAVEGSMVPAIVGAGEQFRAIITGAASEAAGIETAGAVEEAQIEKQSAAAAAGVGGMLPVLIAAAGSIVAGVVAAGAVVGVVNQIIDEIGLGEKIDAAQDRIRATGRYYPGVIRPPEETETEETRPYVGMGDLKRFEYELEQMEAASGDTADAVSGATDEIYEYNKAQIKAVTITKEQERAVDLYIDMLEKQADAVDDFQKRLADLNTDLARDLAEMERERGKEEKKIREDFNKDERERAAELVKQQEDALAEHNKRMRRMDEDHYMKMWDLSLSRDASGYYKEHQRHQIEKARAQEDFNDSQNEAVANFHEEQAQRRAQFNERLQENQNQYEQEKAQRILEWEQEQAELRKEHAETMTRITKEYFDKINAELGYYQMSKEQQRAYYSAMLADVTGFLQRNRQIWQAHVASLPTPGSYATRPSRQEVKEEQKRRTNTDSGRIGGRQAGGYARFAGSYNLAEDRKPEYVMDAALTRQIENALGGGITPSALARAVGGGGPNIRVDLSPQFTNVGAGDRAWIQTELGRVRAEMETNIDEMIAAWGG